MIKRLQDNIIDAFKENSKKERKIAKNGTAICYEFITFSEICNYIKKIFVMTDEKYPGPREIKRKLLALINERAVVEVFGEPPVYFLFEEFNKYKM